MSIILVLLAFNSMVFIHEIGHYLMAKALGIKVREFSMFIGPKIFSFTRNETKFTFRLIPLLAYVNFEGENTGEYSETSIRYKPAWQRFSVYFAGPFLNILLGILILIIVISQTNYTTPIVGEIIPNTPPAIAGIQKGDEILEIDGYKVFTPADIFYFSYYKGTNPIKFKILRSGEKKEVFIKPIKDPLIYKIGIISDNVVDLIIEDYMYIDDTKLSNKNDRRSPAEEAGILIGDKILEINGIKVGENCAVANALKITQNNPATVLVDRGGEKLLFDNVIPAEEIREGNYHYYFNFKNVKGNTFKIIPQIFNVVLSNTRIITYSFAWQLSGLISTESTHGAIGVISSTHETVVKMPNLFRMINKTLLISAYISLGLGAINLFPFPLFDGGRMALIVMEKIIRRRISYKVEETINNYSYYILISFAVFVTLQDILNLFR